MINACFALNFNDKCFISDLEFNDKCFISDFRF